MTRDRSGWNGRGRRRRRRRRRCGGRGGDDRGGALEEFGRVNELGGDKGSRGGGGGRGDDVIGRGERRPARMRSSNV